MNNVNKWAVRMIGILMILGFLAVFAHLHKTLQTMKQMRGPAPQAPAKSP